ncbi:fimbrial protein [Paraburkholderia sp. HD33-4]|uniref:fimbrial protein n=1 Tax=Paraburkholderia sp. HD33-4 TaxID=2883242 RepID=UPI001F39C938|nr:fimbrial protein [Paraburkholderia sp. HD33-4]
MKSGLNEWTSRRISGLRTLVRVLLVVALALSAHSAWALQCLSTTGSTRLTEPIGSVQTYPVNAGNGAIIWISPSRTTNVVCSKDQGGSENLVAEDIYFYPNPNSAPLPGLQIGIRYNGQDYYGGARMSTGYSVPACTQANFNAGRCRSTTVPLTYQVVILKQGTWTGALPDTYAAFQFDGVLGLNAIGNHNFQYWLSGLSNLAPSPCTVDVTVTPEPGIVDFGQIQATTTGFSPAKPTRPFSLLLNKQQCDTGVNILGYFQSSNPVQNNLIVPSSDSNFGIGIQDRSGNQVPIGEPFELMNFGPLQTQASIPFTATLNALGTPKIGPFTATATVLVLYN